MSKLIRITPDGYYRNRITLSSKLIRQERKITLVRFGHACYEASVFVTAELPADQILLSSNIIEKLKLPLQPRYLLKISDYEITIGPYIGLMAFSKKKSLEEGVNVLSNYLYDYDAIGGAILAFTAEGINPEKLLIEGYIYNPDAMQWEHGFYPYPAAVFKRAGLSKTLRDHFSSLLGPKVFNSYIFNKWEMYCWLSQFKASKQYLPETILYEKPEDVIWFLKNYGQAFIKPIYGSQGLGIFIASQIENNYIFKYRENGNLHKRIITKGKEANNFIRKMLLKNRYLIQQSISLLEHEGRIIDFRMLLVKNLYGSWQDCSLIARYGRVGNYVSNISDGGKAELAEDTFRNILKLPETQIYGLRKRVANICIEAANNLEKCGLHVGNLGIDIAIDQDFNIWIIEINNKDPNHTIAIDAKDRQSFYQIKKANMQYAKYLAGFGRE